MSDDTQRIEVTHRDQTGLDIIVTLGTLLVSYYLLDPPALERHKEIAGKLWRKMLHEVSVWQARRAIRSLPETDPS